MVKHNRGLIHFLLCLCVFIFVIHRSGTWEEVSIPIEQFVLTWKGRVVQERVEINTGRVKSLAITMAGICDGQPLGSFNLDIEWIKAARRVD